MIKSFGNQITEDIYNGRDSKHARKIPSEIWNIAARKMDMINAASELQDLLSPPGNRLERLKGNLSEFYSIRINDRYRIIFLWSKSNVEKVQIIDYHK
jgi:toxin HigB-1